MEKDFFDEEFERKEQENNLNEQRRRQVNDWYNYGPGSNGGNSAQNVKHRPLYVVLVCLALVLALIMGWVLCSICTPTTTSGILSEVVSYLDTQYYKDISDEAMLQAIADGGTAILQSAGDQFSRLLTPQQYYDLLYSTDSSDGISASREYFGFSYSNSSVGLYVSEVSVDGSCYGILESGDIILKFTDISTTFGNPLRNSDGEIISQVVVADTDSDELTSLMGHMSAANLHYLRGGEVYETGVVKRGRVGVTRNGNDVVPDTNNFSFIEYFFVDAYGKKHTNLSTIPQNYAKCSTYDLRHLDQLPQGTGYVRIDQFMYYYLYDASGNLQTDENGNASIVTAATEFAKVMQLFKQLGLKRLVLDLKGNPGGSVDAVCDIAGMLVADAKLTDAEKNSVTSTEEKTLGQLRITSLVPRNSADTEYEYRTSTYGDWFDTPSDTCDIVVWTDENSASASELLTGALRDYKTAVQMGACTYGKGIAQTCIPLTNYTGTVVTTNGTRKTFYWAIYYTFAAYYSPLGTNIHGTGYTPESKYNNLKTYEQLWAATREYWGVDSAK